MSDPVCNWDVFCIHASPDKDFVRRLHDSLTPRYRIFLDEICLAPGDEWRRALDQALHGARVFAVFVSSHLDKAFYANAEIITAVNLHRRYPVQRRIVPVLLQRKRDLLTDMPYDLRGIQGIEAAACGGIAGVADKLRTVLDSVPEAGPLRGQNAAEPPTPGAANVDHVLQRYPRTPLVPSHKVPLSIKQAFASLIRVTESRQLVDDANAFRQEADPGDAKVTLIQQYRLRSPENNPPIDFWMDAFTEAGKHGPRMLAALVHVFEDDQFPEPAKKDRKALLEFLQNPG